MYHQVFEEMREALDGRSRDKNTTEIISHTQYQFDLEANKLIIQDFDILTVSGKGGVFLTKGQFPIKRIRPLSDEVKPVGRFFKMDIPASSNDLKASLSHGKPYNGSDIIFEQDGALTSVNLLLKEDILTQDSEEAFAFYIRYELPIDRNDADEMLFFSGAIQPSDYVTIRERLNVRKAKKIVDVIVWRKSGMLRGWAFDGSKPNNFPPVMRSSLTEEKFEQLEWQVEETIDTDWDRARYFSMVVALT